MAAATPWLRVVIASGVTGRQDDIPHMFFK